MVVRLVELENTLASRGNSDSEQRQERWVTDFLPAAGIDHAIKAFVVRDGRLITGQQQYSGAKVADAVIAAVGVRQSPNGHRRAGAASTLLTAGC